MTGVPVIVKGLIKYTVKRKGTEKENKPTEQGMYKQISARLVWGIEKKINEKI